MHNREPVPSSEVACEGRADGQHKALVSTTVRTQRTGFSFKKWSQRKMLELLTDGLRISLYRANERKQETAENRSLRLEQQHSTTQ